MSGWAEKYKVDLGEGGSVHFFNQKYFTLSYAALSYSSRPSSVSAFQVVCSI